MFTTAEKICLKFFLKNKIKREIEVSKIKMAKFEFAIVCEKAFGDK